MTENPSLFSKLKTTAERQSFPRLIGWIILLSGASGFLTLLIDSFIPGYPFRPIGSPVTMFIEGSRYAAYAAMVAAVLMIIFQWGERKSRILAGIGAFFGLLFLLYIYFMGRAMVQLLRI